MSCKPKVTALAPWFGSNRTLAAHVGRAMSDCGWVGVPFAGGMCELVYLTARTLAVNDRHKHVINLAGVVAHPKLGPRLVRQLRRVPFHPDALAEVQERCRQIDADPDSHLKSEEAKFWWAVGYFAAAWMSRNGIAGTDVEFSGGISFRWEASGGDSAVRFRSATESLSDWRRVLSRATFRTDDAFDFLASCRDEPGHGIYADPPFPVAGRRYRHNPGKTDAEEATWHSDLRDALERFDAARVVCRFYDHPLIRELYRETLWHWKPLAGGRKQTNDAAPEVLLSNKPFPAGGPAS